MKSNLITTDAAAVQEKPATEILDKRQFGKRWQFSVRHIDNLLKMGMPHLRVGERRVRIIATEADGLDAGKICDSSSRPGNHKLKNPRSIAGDAGLKV
jgi:hypothetical protein